MLANWLRRIADLLDPPHEDVERGLTFDPMKQPELGALSFEPDPMPQERRDHLYRDMDDGWTHPEREENSGETPVMLGRWGNYL